MMLLKKIRHLVNEDIIETFSLIKDIKSIKDKVEKLEKQIEEKNNKIIEIENINKNREKDIKILANDVIILSNFAKELWVLWQEMGLNEFDLFDIRFRKEKKKDNYH